MSLILHISPPTQHTVTRCKIKFNYDNIHNHIVLFWPDLTSTWPPRWNQPKNPQGSAGEDHFYYSKTIIKNPQKSDKYKNKKTPRNTQKYQKKKFYHGTTNSFEVLHFLSNLSHGKNDKFTASLPNGSDFWVKSAPFFELNNISVLSVWVHGLCCPVDILGKANHACS